METAEKIVSSTVVPVRVAFPEAGPRRLHIGVGACKLVIRPGGAEMGGEWVTGSYYGHVEALPLQVTQEGGEARITQRQEWDEMLELFKGVPTLELTLGKGMPYELAIETGASESMLELGGLPLTNLTLKQGAGRVVADFSAPNPQEMVKLFASAGASGVELKNLLNANFAEMTLEGGAASYKLDFGGALRREVKVKVSAAMCSVDVTIPSSTPARIVSQTMMGGVNIGDGYLKKEGAFWTEAATANLQPVLTIEVTLTMGSLSLHNR
jgi:hypothetical protein